MQFPRSFRYVFASSETGGNEFSCQSATVYNTVDVLVDSGLIVRHQLTAQAVQYELRMLAGDTFASDLYEMRSDQGAEGCDTEERCRSL